MTTRSRILLTLVIALALGDFFVHGIIPAFTPGKNDFSDPLCSSWLWRHGQNPYDVQLATAVNAAFTGFHIPIIPIYPPTTYLLVAPLSLLSWRGANLIWAMLSLAAIALMAFALLRIGNFTTKDNVSWLLVAFVLTFAPFHTAVHVANSAAVSTSLCVLAVLLARQGRDYSAGLTLAIATGLKPQLGVWILLFYAVRQRWRLAAIATAVGALLGTVALLRIPLTPAALLQNYSTNLHFWFGSGGHNDFTAANMFRFQLVNIQVVLHPLLRSVAAANAVAWALFAIGIIIWGSAMFRARVHSEILALSSLLALSLLPFYHRLYDTGILTLALCWALSKNSAKFKLVTRATFVLLLVFLAPGQVILTHLQPYLPPWVAASWWWTSLVAPHAVWTLLLLNGVLLYAVWVSAHSPELKDEGGPSGAGVRMLLKL